jgi:hypothetical protein
MAKLITSSTPKLPRYFALAAASLLGALTVAAAEPASAQGLKHFYMARQQVQITDDAPLVNDQRTFPQAGQPGSQMGAGAPTRPMALPRAGFQSYSSQMPGFNTSLPQVVNGVPPKDPPPVPVKQGKKAKTGALSQSKDKKPTSTASAAKPPVTAAKAYSPYKGYNPGAAASNPAMSQVTQASSTQSKTRVKGSVLHWARGR